MKSAFGVEHQVEKAFGLGQALDMGRDALRGLKLGAHNKAVLRPANGSMKIGNKVGLGANTAGKKLKPMVNTPLKAAGVAGGAGLGTGLLLGSKSNN